MDSGEPVAMAAKKLDLSRLTDAEAKHVWHVVQRDFDLRKKEEDRLGEMKTKLEKEDTKRELLGNQSSLTESHCIRCLQPFNFLLSGKRQCLDCSLFTCKACSCYSKKEQGWLCTACHMARVLKIGTLEWYHDNVRTRFKRFGSAKVMRSLFKRLSGGHSCPQSEMGEPHEYDTQSMPEVHDGDEEHSMDATDPQYKGRKKTKRRLTVDPCVFKLGGSVSGKPRGRLDQQTFASLGDPDILVMDVGGGEAVVLTERRRGRGLDLEGKQEFLPLRPASRLSHSSCSGGGGGGAYPPDDSDDSDEPFYPPYQPHLALRSHASQESLTSANPPPQIGDLDRRMSAIETVLSRIEQKVSSRHEQTPMTPNSSSPPPPLEDVDLEELQLRQKLHELTDNISDHSLSSDEDGSSGASGASGPPTRPPSRAGAVVSRGGEDESQTSRPSSSGSPERRVPVPDESPRTGFRGSTAMLAELEGRVAQAAASVQSAESEVSLLEDRIAALNAAGVPEDRRRKSAIPVQARRLSHNFPTKAGHDAGLLRRRLSIM